MPDLDLPAGICPRYVTRLAESRLQQRLGSRRQAPARKPLTVSLQAKRLGGLESGEVVRIDARGKAPSGATAVTRLVIKPMRNGAPAREGAVYRWLQATGRATFGPAVLCESQVGSPEGGFLLMEHLRPAGAWPWRNPEFAAHALERLADLHAGADVASFAAAVPAAFYDEGLSDEVESTLRVLHDAIRAGSLPIPPGTRSAVARIADYVARFPRSSTPALPETVLHGDVHSGNVVLTSSGSIAMIDWSRARVGAPLDDVASWLQSLAFWEPEVRRAHDTLLRRYLAARGVTAPLDAGLRDAYWISAARNGFTGALRYHIVQIQSPTTTPRARHLSTRAALDWFRIMRRAALASGPRASTGGRHRRRMPRAIRCHPATTGP